MRTIFKSHFLVLLLGMALISCAQDDGGQPVNAASEPGNLVTNIEEFNDAVAALQPGDKVVLANGTWRDVELKLKAK